MPFRIERWRVQSSELPRIWRYCSRCRRSCAFLCAERFRVNAQKKIIDIWLLYRCAECDATWKLPIIERSRVDDIDALRLSAYERNAGEVARRHASDLSRLGPVAIRIEMNDRLRVDRQFVSDACESGDVIRIQAQVACQPRLDRLLAQVLVMSRGELARRHEEGSLLVSPDRRRALARPIHDGQEICFVGGISSGKFGY